MSSPKWTKQQQDVIDSRGGNLLVAAAAGSGKTAVLVERIIQMILNENQRVDIDKLLVVTFTNAAASEMRERIGDAISKKLDENPDNEHLQDQLILLNKASITTIHSFCLEVIKSNFHKIDLDPNFRIGDETECSLMKLEAIDEMFDKLYEEKNEEFCYLVDCYAEKRGDSNLQKLILSIYSFVMASPYPKKWLRDSAEDFNIDDSFEFENSKWSKAILETVQIQLEGIEKSIRKAIENIAEIKEIETFTTKLRVEYLQIKELLEACQTSWDEVYRRISNFQFENYAKGVKRIPKGAPEYVKYEKDKAKDIRDKAKASIESIKKNIFNKSKEDLVDEIKFLYPVVKSISDVVIMFDEVYTAKKREKGIIDFNDIEHFALEIFTKKDEDGNFLLDEKGKNIPSDIALEYREKFHEIFIDEYQDSNQVQEVILSTIAKVDKPNRFMVGDVKQSIYRFRQAKPEIFLDKYSRYEDDLDAKFKKILLFKNFRSRKEVVDSVNYIFEHIMSRNLGEIEYDEKERLNLGAMFEEVEDENVILGGATEIHLMEKKSEEVERVSEDDEPQEEEDLDAIQIEARMVGKIIKDLIARDGDKMMKVFDKRLGQYRKVDYRDIVILLRATSSWAPVFTEELMNMDIPTYADTGKGYFDTMEIQIMMSYLKVIDNPMQDIPLIAVLRSPIYGFTPEDFIDIRMVDKKVSFYEAMKKLVGYDIVIQREVPSEEETQAIEISDEEAYLEQVQMEIVEEEAPSVEGDKYDYISDELKEKVRRFLDKIQELQKRSMYMTTDEFLWYIYEDSGYYAYCGALPGGSQRQANLKVLFERAKQFDETSFKGIFNFINFINKLKKSESDMGAAKTLGENANVVRIMSIHKSKGLEFPVVICSAMGKNFNTMDFRKDVLYHHELGYGPQIVDFERRISYPSIAKEALKAKINIENISEEMRILYVALTRAKEKLIITGSVKDIERNIHKWSANATEAREVSKHEILNGKNFLDWIMPAVIKHVDLANIRGKYGLEVPIYDDEESNWYMKTWKKEEINFDIQEKEGVREILDNLDLEETSTEYYKDIEEKLNFRYPYMGVVKKSASISVTEIKKIQNSYEEDMSDNIYRKKTVLKKPKFMREEKEERLTPMRKGTIAHLIMEVLDFNRASSEEEIKAQIEGFVKSNIITEKESKVLSPKKILKFLNSDIGRRVLSSKFVKKEQKIYTQIEMNDVYKNEEEFKDNLELYDGETLMLRGIIDLYFEEDDEIVIVDYKTDWVEYDKLEEIKNRYKIQLELYAKALSELTGKTIKGKYLYLFRIDKAIEV